MQLKILHCTHSLSPQVGGPSRFIEQVALLSPNFDMNIEVLCVDSPNSPWLENFPAPVHAFGPGLGKYGFSPNLLNWLNNHINDFDLIVVNGLWQFTGAAVRLAAKAAGKPYVVFPHGMLDPWFNREYRLKHAKKIPYWLLVEQHVLHDASAVLFTSEEERLQARQSFRPYDVKELVIGYGTMAPEGDLVAKTIAFFSKHPDLERKRFLLFLSRLHEKKGCDLLIKAFCQAGSAPGSAGHLPGTTAEGEPFLVLAGPSDPAYLATLQRLTTAYPPDISSRIKFIGMLQGDLKWGALIAADALCLPSHQENFAQVVSESLSCGTPVFISNKVNIWREIVETGAGIADSDDFEGTQRLVRSWLDLDPSKHTEMKSRALACFQQKFDMRVFFPRYVETLRALIG